MYGSFIPLVDPDIGPSVAEGLCNGCESDDLDAWKDEIRKIKLQNPVIAEFIKEWTRQAKGRDSKLHTLICGVCVYKMLASQAEADKMKQELRLE